jgi:hypothetical protein
MKFIYVGENGNWLSFNISKFLDYLLLSMKNVYNKYKDCQQLLVSQKLFLKRYMIDDVFSLMNDAIKLKNLREIIAEKMVKIFYLPKEEIDELYKNFVTLLREKN